MKEIRDRGPILTINENESIGYWRYSNNHIKFCGRHIGALQGMERRIMKTTLLIMAAGIGSRFGTGIKQLEPVDDAGHIIMDYSIHDAIEAGFNHVVFIIRKDIEKEFKEVIGERIAIHLLRS